MGLLQGYLSALKPLDVEEPIDVYVHRPPAYLLARLLLPTPVTPDQVTIASMGVGVLGGVLIAWPFPGHLTLAALCIFASTVLDCADGMLARLRRSSSALGRMLDGIADLVTISAVVAGHVVLVVSQRARAPWEMALVLVAMGATVFTSARHTAGYDHYKNVWLRLTTPRAGEAEDLPRARARFEAERARGLGLVGYVAWRIYLGYLSGQRAWVKRFDPFTVQDLAEVPAGEPACAARYRHHGARAMKHWRSVFGVGSLMAGLTVATALGWPELLVGFRLVVLNGVLYLILQPIQRQASREAFAGVANHAGRNP
ncbi:CDP-alcohol phosphatidyltransferase family protein [Chondromyces crocatus]|uniref:CDP-alcohol phosphatidyltransferase n=1 Tax=Chondromyces crocatus TaxID=52 RepID=A0A0K1E4X6_CHOCO|nr:CDP-alcohol phosphatidyltransferase family protein [Chondromyces crocatus]AKT35909.1 uncharacterized protein CMC5_000200 [Chondromyces crocatus]